MLEIGDFFGINPDLRINPNSIPDTDNVIHKNKLRVYMGAKNLSYQKFTRRNSS